MAAEKKIRVLIADDEPSMRLTLSDILSDNDFHVSTANDGISAVEICQRETFDVVLMDVRMPGIDGVEAFKQIRQSLDQVRIILMSAYGEDELKHEALRNGAIAFLDKPLDLETVIALVGDAPGTAILAVTDDNDFSTLLPASLKTNNQRITIVSSANEAVNLVRQLQFDIVMIDVELPTINGLDLYLELRELSPTITAIMISAPDGESLKLAEEAVRRTAYMVMKKPLHPETLAEIVEQLKSQRRSGFVRKPNLDES